MDSHLEFLQSGRGDGGRVGDRDAFSQYNQLDMNDKSQQRAKGTELISPGTFCIRSAYKYLRATRRHGA